MASILRVNTLTDASSNNSIATSVLFNGSAKAWIKFRGDTTGAIIASYGITSISNPDNAKNIAEFRIFSLKKFKEWLLINDYIFSLWSYILGELKKPLL